MESSFEAKRGRVAALAVLSNLIGLGVLMHGAPAQAQERSAKPIPGITRQPSAAAARTMLDPSDTVILLLDHQTGLFQTVKDIPVAELRNNAVTLATLAEHAKVPIFTTASEPNGPNGPLMPELAKAAPSARYIPRK